MRHIITSNIKKKHNRFTHGLNAHTLTGMNPLNDMDVF